MNSVTEYAVRGMTCAHCVSAVTDELTKLAGVCDVRINLVVDGNSVVQVESDSVLDPAQVRAAVDEAGYELMDPNP